MLFIAGQTAGSAGDIASDDLAEQFDQALARVLEVVRAAGGAPEDLATLTIFVTDMDAYRAARKALGPRYQARMGSHYPAMALVEVVSLLNPRARVEIQGIAVLGG
jgi:enamine deaminase RidA (YjgF/YER057c/UK114 family)